MTAKVNINQTPSEKIMGKAKACLKEQVTDPQGRVFKLRVPDAVDEFDLSSALGVDSGNPGCAAITQALLYIESIDGAPFQPPKSYAQVRAALQRVGSDGLRTVGVAMREYARELGDLQSEQEQLNEIKK